MYKEQITRLFFKPRNKRLHGNNKITRLHD